MNFYSVRDLRTTPKTIWENLAVDGEALREVRDGVEVFGGDRLHEGEFLVDGGHPRPGDGRAVEAEHGEHYAHGEQGGERLDIAHLDRADDYAWYADYEPHRERDGEPEIFLFGFESEFHISSAAAAAAI